MKRENATREFKKVWNWMETYFPKQTMSGTKYRELSLEITIHTKENEMEEHKEIYRKMKNMVSSGAVVKETFFDTFNTVEIIWEIDEEES